MFLKSYLNHLDHIDFNFAHFGACLAGATSNNSLYGSDLKKKKSIPGDCDDNELNFIITYCNGNGGMLNIK